MTRPGGPSRRGRPAPRSSSAAQRLFLRDGFAATTIAAIAAEAQVSAETIYKAFGGKPGLVRAICDAALAGEGPVPAETRSDQLQLHEPDPRKIIRGWGELTAEVAPRIAPIMLLVRVRRRGRSARWPGCSPRSTPAA